MRKIIFLLIFIFVVKYLFASGFPIHGIIAEKLFDDIYNEYVSCYSETFSLEFKEDLKDEFIIGSVFPDLFRYKDEIEQYDFILDILVNLIPELPKDLIKVRIDDFGVHFPDISDVHRVGATKFISMITNDKFLTSNIKMQHRKKFLILGIYSHVLEDLYVDLIWQNYLCEKYSGGTFTAPHIIILSILNYFRDNYQHYNAFSSPETLLDFIVSADAWLGDEAYQDYKKNQIPLKTDAESIDDNLYNIDDELFDELFQASMIQEDGWYWHLVPDDIEQIYSILNNEESIIYDFWHYDEGVSATSDVEIQKHILLQLINIMSTYESDDILPISSIPSFLFNNLDSLDYFSIKSSWNAQKDNGSNESVKKSLIGQLYDSEDIGYITDASMKSRFFHLPEIMVYDVTYEIRNEESSNYVYAPNQQKFYEDCELSEDQYVFAIPTKIDYEDIKITMDIFSPILYEDQLYDLLKDKIKLYPYPSPKGIKIRIDVLGDVRWSGLSKPLFDLC